MKSSTDTNQQVQGEGDYKADRRYTESARSFAKSGKVAEAARQAKPATPREEAELQRAEQEGIAHSRGEDPALQHAPPRKP